MQEWMQDDEGTAKLVKVKGRHQQLLACLAGGAGLAVTLQAMCAVSMGWPESAAIRAVGIMRRWGVLVYRHRVQAVA